MGGTEPGPGRLIVLSVMPCQMYSWTGFQFIYAVSLQAPYSAAISVTVPCTEGISFEQSQMLRLGKVCCAVLGAGKLS